ncbi:hypothetical protein ACFPM7_11915 [Actinokineospora guangxiensis]|uniref:Uncharacterized protein n=1 Tax=Actinokineospora guangxiensis TaxID=1490288 RepID=A0ABW0EN88_9PSEU
MNQAYVLDYVRTARGRATPRGGLHHLSPLELVTGLLRALAARTPELADGLAQDVVLGCAHPHGEQGSNPARAATLLAGWATGSPAWW